MMSQEFFDWLFWSAVFHVKKDKILGFEELAANLHMLVKRKIWTFIRAIFAVSGKKCGILRMISYVRSEMCLFWSTPISSHGIVNSELADCV